LPTGGSFLDEAGKSLTDPPFDWRFVISTAMALLTFIFAMISFHLIDSG
jgi:hypothetical protein